MKAPPAKYAAAKRIALTTLIKRPPDAPVPDEIHFRNDEIAFVIRLYHGDKALERYMSWTVVDTSVEYIAETVKRALEELARAQ